jgi:hypothetical protein
VLAKHVQHVAHVPPCPPAADVEEEFDLDGFPLLPKERAPKVIGRRPVGVVALSGGRVRRRRSMYAVIAGPSGGMGGTTKPSAEMLQPWGSFHPGDTKMEFSARMVASSMLKESGMSPSAREPLAS